MKTICELLDNEANLYALHSHLLLFKSLDCQLRIVLSRQLSGTISHHLLLQRWLSMKNIMVLLRERGREGGREGGGNADSMTRRAGGVLSA